MAVKSYTLSKVYTHLENFGIYNVTFRNFEEITMDKKKHQDKRGLVRSSGDVKAAAADTNRQR